MAQLMMDSDPEAQAEATVKVEVDTILVDKILVETMHVEVGQTVTRTARVKLIKVMQRGSKLKKLMAGKYSLNPLKLHPDRGIAPTFSIQLFLARHHHSQHQNTVDAVALTCSVKNDHNDDVVCDAWYFDFVSDHRHHRHPKKTKQKTRLILTTMKRHQKHPSLMMVTIWTWISSSCFSICDQHSLPQMSDFDDVNSTSSRWLHPTNSTLQSPPTVAECDQSLAVLRLDER